ncbi:MAG: hypothetical protein ABI431_01000 [Candidatus Tumulicola sp.]
MIPAVVAVVVAIALVAVILASRSSRRVPVEPTSWTGQAGEGFEGLSEAARCDMIFAIAELPGADRTAMLREALDDPSEAVVLAAANALTARGEDAVVQTYFAARPGARSERIARDLSLLTGATASF